MCCDTLVLESGRGVIFKAPSIWLGLESELESGLSLLECQGRSHEMEPFQLERFPWGTYHLMVKESWYGRAGSCAVQKTRFKSCSPMTWNMLSSTRLVSDMGTYLQIAPIVYFVAFQKKWDLVTVEAREVGICLIWEYHGGICVCCSAVSGLYRFFLWVCITCEGIRFEVYCVVSVMERKAQFHRRI